MKKTIILCMLLSILCFFTGYFSCLEINADSIESCKFKWDLIDAQNAALKKAEIVMDNNNLYDIDGSDEMEDYLNLCQEVDSLCKTQS